jgi:hypothetical protein
MSNLIPANGGYPSFTSNREQRSLARQVARVEQGKVLGLARVEQQAELQAAKVQALGFVGSQAMQAAALVSELEGRLGTACPLAVTRVQAIADVTALEMLTVVTDTAWRLR